MTSKKLRHYPKIFSLIIIIIVVMIALSTTGSCFLNTDTMVCRSAQYELRCPTGWICSRSQDMCILASCGNGQVDPGEQCDPLAKDSIACNDNCTQGSICGNGIQESGEECDSLIGDTNVCNGSNAKSIISDSNAKIIACQLSRCGDFYVNTKAGEMCDKGPEDTAACNGNGNDVLDSAKCHPPSCGDGHANSKVGEQCDQLGGVDTGKIGSNPGCNGIDAGSLMCKFSECGDGYVNLADREECDPIDGKDTSRKDANNPGCNGSRGSALSSLKCKFSRCGDGYRNDIDGEQCDTLGGADSIGCNGINAPDFLKCKESRCGDKYVNKADLEECDNGDTDTGSSSGDNGELPACNGRDAKDQEGNAVSCKKAQCGDGYTNKAAHEDCDDNGSDTVLCNGNHAGSASCRFRQCGDGYLNKEAHEQCEKGSKCDDNKTCEDCMCI